MNKYLVADAISYLDADLLAEHLKKKEKLKNKSNSKKKMSILKWSSMAASFCLILVVAFFLVIQIQNRPDNPFVPPETGNNTEAPDVTPSQPSDGFNNGIDFNSLPAIASMYKVDDYSSMVKVEVNNVLGKFSLGLGEPRVLLVEFCVIEDYYNKISPRTVIIVPIAMDGTGIVNESMLVDLQMFLDDADEFVLYIDRLYEMQSIYDESGVKVDKRNVASLNLMINHTIIPQKNEKVDASATYELLDKYEISYYSPQKINGYSLFVVDEMPTEELEENIVSLYQWHINTRQNTTESLPADKGYD